jgi:Leucine-rich repeat (LRR) protein
MKIDNYLIKIDRFQNHSFLVKPFYEGYHHHLVPGLSVNQNISLGDRVVHVIEGISLCTPLLNYITYIALGILFPFALDVLLNTLSRLALDIWVFQAGEGEQRDVAKNKILECLRTASTILDLSHLGLTTLPEMIGSLSNLERLRLNNNQLTSLPETIGNLSKLKDLNLSINQLTSIPKEIGNLTNLEWLDLSFNQLTSIPVTIGNLSNLESLYLSDNQLTSVPGEIGNLSKMKWLYLNNNQLISLPETIGNLSKLKELNLSDNQLTSVPGEIGNLSNLKWLYLNNNQLISLPETIGNLSKLKELNLSINQLTSIPKEIGNLTNLEWLDLSFNQLTSIPKEIGNLSNLKWLYLNNNQLTSIPVIIGNLSNLKRLDLGYNQLTSIPITIGNLSNLESLYLSNNQLTSLPVTIGNLNNLQRFDVGNNRLTSLPASFFHLPRGSNVHLTGNLFSRAVINRISRVVGSRFNVHISVHNRSNLEPLRTIREGLEMLYRDAGKPFEDQSLLLTEVEEGYLLTFINKLRTSLTKIYQDSCKKKTANLLIQCLEFAKEDSDFKGALFVTMEEASSSCGDRVSLNMNYIYGSYHLYKGIPPEDMTLIDFFVGLKRIQLLEGYAKSFVRNPRNYIDENDPRNHIDENDPRNHIDENDSRDDIDELEVYLGLQIKLRQSLKLPLFTREMLYYSSSTLPDSYIEEVRDEVLEKTKDRKAVATGNKLLETFICRVYETKYKEISDDFAKQLEPDENESDETESKQEKSDSEIMEDMKKVQEAREAAIAKFVQEKIEELLTKKSE